MPFDNNTRHIKAPTSSSSAAFNPVPANKPAAVLRPPEQAPSPNPQKPAQARRFIVPAFYTQLEPRRPLSAYNDDPLFDTADAAKLLGISEELLKKWRMRRQGPDYVQYGKSGPVRYFLSDLKAYRVAHKVRLGNGQQ